MQGWTDLNKNGKKDIYENPEADIESRIDDLLKQMTLDEKTCQMCTLYGYQRVLKTIFPNRNGNRKYGRTESAPSTNT